MKKAVDVTRKLASLVQSSIATSAGGERFVDASSSDAGLIVTAQALDGTRRQFRVKVEPVEEPKLPVSDPGQTVAECADDEATPAQEASSPQEEAADQAAPPTGTDSEPCEGSAEQATEEAPPQPPSPSAD